MKTNTTNRMLPAWLRRTAMALVAVMGLHSLAPMSYGSPIVSQAISTEALRAADLITIQKALEQKVVQHRLVELGFTPSEIQSRMELASNADLHQLAVQSQTLTTGGDAGIGLLVTILIIILLVLLIKRVASQENYRDMDQLAA